MSVLRELRALVGDAEWMWTNAQVLTADVEVDHAAASAWLPTGLRMDRPARATLFIADYPETSFDAVYREAAVLLHVRLGPMRSIFCPWMLVDDDVALILGREILGFPKKMGEMSLEVGSDRVLASASRRGATLIEMQGTLGEPLHDPPPFIARRTTNVWGALGLSLQRLLTFHPREKILEARRVDATVTVRGSRRDPLDELRCGPAQNATLYRCNVGAGKGFPLPTLPVSPHFALRSWKLRQG